MHGEMPYRLAMGVVILLTVAVMVPFRVKAASSGERISHEEEGGFFAATLQLAGLLLWISTFAYLLFPSVVRWASLPVPAVLRWAGAIAGVACSALLYWTLSSLGKNLTDTVVIRKNATLVTHGPYRWVRHPYYVVAALLMASVTLLTANWLIGISSLFVLTLLAVRTPKEEQMLIQRFGDQYQLVNGVAMHTENPEHFHIPPDIIKRHIRPGQFVELRIDSPRFSVHEDAPEKCTCPSCNGEVTKPILRHDHPASLMPLPKQKVRSRGWGEDFWVQVTERSGDFLKGTVDNPLVEARLHELHQG